MYDTLLTIHFVAMAAAVGMGIFVPVLAAVTARTAPDSVPAVMGPVGRAQSGLEALRVVSDVVGDIPDLAMRLKRVLVRLDEAGTGDARRLERFARNERYRAIWSTLALWAIAAGALMLAFRGG